MNAEVGQTMERGKLVLLFPADHYRRLADWAEEEERTAEQQAAWVLRMALRKRGRRVPVRTGPEVRVPA